MKKISFLVIILILIFSLTSFAATFSNFNDSGSRDWDIYVEENLYNDFIVNIPSSGSLIAGTPLNTPFAGKYITFDQDITFIPVDDYFIEIDWNQGWRTLNMINTGKADQIVMTLHGFSVSGFGFELKPNSDGWYKAGFKYLTKEFISSANGDDGTSPYFLGTIGNYIINSITIFTDIIENSGLDTTGFYLGDLHLIENSSVPAPSTLILLFSGLIGFAGIKRRKNI